MSLDLSSWQSILEQRSRKNKRREEGWNWGGANVRRQSKKKALRRSHQRGEPREHNQTEPADKRANSEAFIWSVSFTRAQSGLQISCSHFLKYLWITQSNIPKRLRKTRAERLWLLWQEQQVMVSCWVCDQISRERLSWQKIGSQSQSVCLSLCVCVHVHTWVGAHICLGVLYVSWDSKILTDTANLICLWKY